MPEQDSRIAILREHVGWARTYAIFWFVLCLAVFAGAHFVADFIGLSPELRTPLFLMVGTIIVVNAIWQAAALSIVRLEEVVLPRMGRLSSR